MEHFSKDYHCVAFDMRGYNESDKPEGIEAYGLNYLAEDVKAVIEGKIFGSNFREESDCNCISQRFCVKKISRFLKCYLSGKVAHFFMKYSLHKNYTYLIFF